MPPGGTIGAFFCGAPNGGKAAAMDPKQRGVALKQAHVDFSEEEDKNGKETGKSSYIRELKGEIPLHPGKETGLD